MTPPSRYVYTLWGRLALTLALALTLGLLAGCDSHGGSTPLNYPQTIADARIRIWEFLKEYQAPSATVALVAGDRIVWSETIDRVGTTTPETMFGIGSVSKIFAAAAVMKLVDEGRIDLDAPLVRYLPDFRMVSPEYAQISVRMLLNHSAGFGGADFRNMFAYAPLTGYAEQVQAALATQRLKHAPGYLSVYCNDCVTMVEPLIAAVTGKPYTQYVREEIFAPLGMTHSRFALAPFPPGSFAPGYDLDGNPEDQEFGQAYASGGIYTTPNDMARFAMMLMNGGWYGKTRLLSAAAVAEMGRDQTRQLPFNPVPTYARGLGWDNVTHSGLAAVGVRAWHKKGGTMVYETDFVVAPDEGLAVMISVSQRTMQTGLLAEQILLHALAENGRIPAVPAPLPETPLPERPPTDAELAALVGVYANKNGPIRVEAAPDRTLKVWVYYGGQWVEDASGLKRRSDGTFSSNEAPNLSYRALVADGRRYLVKKEPHWSGHYLEESLYAQAIEPAKQPLSRAWQALAGHTWLAVNEDAQSWILVSGLPPRFTLDTLEQYPGYLFATSPYLANQIVDPPTSDWEARMFLKIGLELGRDLNDVVIENREGEAWVRYGSNLFRPKATVPPLPVGDSVLSIGDEGLAEWRQVREAGAVAISGASAWKIYKADLTLHEAGQVTGHVSAVPAGSYLLLYGALDATIRVTLMP